MKHSKDLTRPEMEEMARTFNQVLQLDPPIDLTLPDEKLSEAIVMAMLAALPDGALDLPDGQKMGSKDIILEKYLSEQDGFGPQVFPIDGEVDTEKN
jgi:hypothetical protein